MSICDELLMFLVNLQACCRVVRRFFSRRFHPKSRRLFPFYFCNITLRTDLLTFGVTGPVFKIAGEMQRLPAYFDNPAVVDITHPKSNTFVTGVKTKAAGDLMAGFS